MIKVLNKDVNEQKLYRQKCDECTAELEFAFDDTYIGALGARYVKCPICGKTFKTKAVKVNSPRIISKDSDFFIRYSVVNPYFYDVWICNSCGYAAMKSDFLKVKSYEKDGCVYTFNVSKDEIFMNDKEKELHLCQDQLLENAIPRK